MPDAVLFDCDASVHELLTTPAVVARVSQVFGDSILDKSGRIDRAKLREIVFKDSSFKAALEGILHPEVRRLCHAARKEAENQPQVSVFLADVPLFFENGFPLEHDKKLVVATTRAVQFQRLQNRSRLDPEQANRIIDAQIPINQKIVLADLVVWNGGSTSSLQRQIEYLKTWMLQPSK